MEEIRQRLGDSCIDFSEEADARNENLAMCDEKVLETYLEKGTVTDEQVCRMVTGRKVFPCILRFSPEIDRGAGVDWTALQNGQKRGSIRRHSGPEYLKSQGMPRADA